MQTSQTPCNQKLLELSLVDTLTEQQEEQLATHLAQCETCCTQLQALAGAPHDWSRIQSVLQSETASASAGSVTTLLPERSGVSDGCRSTQADSLVSDFAVNFLEPASQPGLLGRLQQIDIHGVIGHGGNGIVLKGMQPELNRLVAVKVMAPQLAMSAPARQRFAREAQATAAVVHPNVMPILSVHSSGQLPFLVMPYVNCESLQQRLDREGILPVVDILRIGHQVAGGLAAAHAQGLVHRDVKPANILLERGVDRVMLTDFGLARAVDDGSLTRTGLIAGTPQYMSPEQARGDTVDTRSDLFSLGSVIYAMCTGRPPFRADTTYGILRRITDDTARPIGELNVECPGWLSGLIGQLMARSASDRPPGADHIADVFERCLAHVQNPAGNPLPSEAREADTSARVWTHWPLSRWIADFRSAWLMAVAAIALMWVTIAAFPGFSGPAKPEHRSGPESEKTAEIEAASSSASDLNTIGPDAKRAVPDAPAKESSIAESVSDGKPEWETSIDSDLESLSDSVDDLLRSLSEQSF